MQIYSQPWFLVYIGVLFIGLSGAFIFLVRNHQRNQTRHLSGFITVFPHLFFLAIAVGAMTIGITALTGVVLILNGLQPDWYWVSLCAIPSDYLTIWFSYGWKRANLTPNTRNN